jgi:sulfopyruvate decarboxylase TPP-binding subunit
MKYIGIQDKLLENWIQGIDYITPSDEGEGMAIACGLWLATNERATVFMSADGFCNCMNFFTSYVIPEGIEMNLLISTGREEPPHKVMTDILPELLELLNYDPKRIHINIIRKQ